MANLKDFPEKYIMKFESTSYFKKQCISEPEVDAETAVRDVTH